MLGLQGPVPCSGGPKPQRVAHGLRRPWPRLERAASPETSHCQADFPFSFPSSCYFSAIPRGKTRWTHSIPRARLATLWAGAGGYRIDVRREKAQARVGQVPGQGSVATPHPRTPDPRLRGHSTWHVLRAPRSAFWGVCP